MYKEFRVSRRKKWYLLRNFAQEVHLQSLLSSKRIMPPVKALWYRREEKEDYVYLQMPSVGSENLQEFLIKESLSFSEYQTLAEDLIHKIDTISKCGFLWWDCKPANIVVTEEGGLHPVDCGNLYLIKLESASEKILIFLNRLFLRLHLRLALKFAPECFVSFALKSLATMLAADFLSVKEGALQLLDDLVVSSEKSEHVNGPEALEVMDPLYLINEYAHRCGCSKEFASNEKMLAQGSLDDDAGLQIK